MKERSGKDSKVEFQSGKKKKTPLPKPRPDSITKQYSNPVRKPSQPDRKLATTYTMRIGNPEPKAPKPNKYKRKLPLSGKNKRGTRSRLNPFIDYGDKKKKAKPPLEFNSPSGKKGGSDALYRVPDTSKIKKKKLKT